VTAINWENGVNGDWNVAADWSTGTIPTSSDDVTFFTAEPYLVTVGAGISIGFGTLRSTIFPTANSLTFDAPDAALRENTGMLIVAGTLTVNSGLVSLNEANSIGSVAVTGGVVEVGNSGALGAGTVSLSGGELLATANVSLANSVNFSGTSTIAAANGTTLKETGTVNTGFNSTLNFGALGQDGVVIWAADNETLGLPITVNVVAGTLKTASSSLAGIIEAGIPLGRAQPTTVDAGATLDIDGLGLLVANLLGGGAVTDSGAAATLTLDAANFSGAISGPLSLEADGAVTLAETIPIPGPRRSSREELSNSATAARPARLTAPLAMAANSPSTTTTRSRSPTPLAAMAAWNSSGRASRRSTPPTIILAARPFRPGCSPSAPQTRWEPVRLSSAAANFSRPPMRPSPTRSVFFRNVDHRRRARNDAERRREQ
jgi:hypothetical protein